MTEAQIKEFKKSMIRYNKIKKGINEMLKDINDIKITYTDIKVTADAKPKDSDFPWDYYQLEEDDEIGCQAYTSNLKKCKSKVKYVIKSMPKYKKYKNIHICARHFKVLKDSEDQMTLKNGFIFDGECYV